MGLLGSWKIGHWFFNCHSPFGLEFSDFFGRIKNARKDQIQWQMAKEEPIFNFQTVDPGRIGLPPQQCECRVIPLYYGPIKLALLYGFLKKTQHVEPISGQQKRFGICFYQLQLERMVMLLNPNHRPPVFVQDCCLAISLALGAGCFFESPGLGLLVAGVGFVVTGLLSFGRFADWQVDNKTNFDEALKHPRPAACLFGAKLAFNIAAIFFAILWVRIASRQWPWFKSWMYPVGIGLMAILMLLGMIFEFRRVGKGLRYAPNGSPLEDNPPLTEVRPS